MTTILVVFQTGSEVRQFGHSGFIASLIEKGWKVLVGSRRDAEPWQSEINPAVTYVGIPRQKPSLIYEQVASGLDLAQARRRQKAGLSNWSYGPKSPPRSYKQVLRRSFQTFLGIMFLNPVLFKWGRWLEAQLVDAQGTAGFSGFLDRFRPDAIVVNVPRFHQQSLLLSAAQARGIPRFLFFHTNKDVVALSRIDHHFTGIGVWNQWMREQLLAQNPHISPESVLTTGCGHFDCVGRSDWVIPETDFRQMIGAGSEDRLVLYTAGGPGVIPAEERFIEAVFRALQALNVPNTRLVVRRNPMDSTTRMEDYLHVHLPQVITIRPDWFYSQEANICFQREADGVLFSNLLHYSAVCVGIPSTLTVECALTGLPVVNLGFDLPGPQPLPGSIRAFWEVDFYTNVRHTHAALLAKDPAELETAIQLCLENRCLLREQQQHLIAIELGGIYPPRAQLEYVAVLQRHI